MPTHAVSAGPARAGRVRRGLPARLALPLLLAVACSDGGSGPDLPVPNAVQVVDGNAQSGVVGETLSRMLVVKVTDAKGRALQGVSVAWSIESGGGSVESASVTGLAGTAATRWTLGTVAGSASVRATAGERTATFTATVNPGGISAVSLTPTTFTLDPGAQRQLQVAVTDAFGNAIAGRTASWQSTEPLIATVDNTGNVRAVAGGTATIRATVETRTANATVTVTGPPAPIPTIGGIAPDILTPGITATITGTNFATAAGATKVTINGADAAVTSATATQLQVAVPGADRLGCTPLAPVDVTVSVGSARAVRPHPLQTATRRSFGVAEVAYSTTGSPLGCIELAAGSGHYLVAVYNIGPPFGGSGQDFVNTGPSIQLRTAIGGTAGDIAGAAVSAPSVLARASAAVGTFESDRLTRHLRVHERVMDENMRLLRSVRVPRPGAFAGRASLVNVPPAVGDSLWIRFPDVSKESSAACSQFDSVRARVAFVGSRAIVLEDIAAPLAGQVDSLMQRMGSQFDQVQYPLIRDDFGDPLVLDSQLNNDGHIYMLFTRRVNGLFNGNILGYTWSGDFDDGTLCRQSNRAEIFYGIVPTVLSGGAATDWDVQDWYNFSRSTVIHEVKHVASMAARQKNGDLRFFADSMWLEEATAMVAEELWARQVFGYQQQGNTGFDQSIRCELNLSGSGCTGMPIVMLNHFAFLYDYYERADSLSFFGRAATNDATFYGSAWAFLRWLTDHSGMTEAQFLSRLTQATTAGITSIQAVTGKSYEDLFREFVLASALDDRSGFTSPNTRLSQPSWNTRDVFGGMSQLQIVGSGVKPFPLPFPFVSRAVTPPGTTITQVRPGGAVLFELDVPSTGAQAVDVTGAGGAVLPAGLRVAIIRMQ